MKFTCGRPLDALKADAGTCGGRPRLITAHLYRCPECKSVQWRRPKSKHYPRGEHVIFGWGDYRNDPEAEAKETSASFEAMWELLARLEQREKMIDWYEAHAMKQEGQINRLREALNQVHLMADASEPISVQAGSLARRALEEPRR